MDRLELARRLGAEAGRVAEPNAGAVVIDESEPERFQAALASAVAGGGDVFLADPEWGEARRRELAEIVAGASGATAGAGRNRRGWLMIPSGGTSGRLKFARHDEETIGAAVRGFAEHFGLARVNAIGVLPLHHVSGLMSWLRCALTGGEYRAMEWKALAEGRVGSAPAPGTVLSLVPTQLQRLLARPETVAWLRGFAAIFVGGGPAWPALLDAAARAELKLSLSYGMTETAAMVTALRPAEFAAGNRSSGGALPHARVRVNEEGRIAIAGASLFRGYYPDDRREGEFVTEDAGRWDEHGHLVVLGRTDAAIITGGKKVHPAEVEAVLRASGEFEDVAVIGVPDADWGEAVVACYPAGNRVPESERASAALAAWMRPKRFVAIAAWPRNAQGKVDRAGLRAVVVGSGQ